MIKLNEIQAEVSKIMSSIVNFRRHIHQNPELSFEEWETSKFIIETLNKYDIKAHTIAKTGVTALIGQGETCVALRADIDALPIQEETNLDFASNVKGKMHACGHDMHTSMLLGAAIILKKYETELNGQIKLIFQPGEEKLPGGASIIIDEGILDNPKVEAIFGQHIYPGAKSGTISLCEGPIMASADELYFTIKGKSTHAAQPHLGNDPILAASQLIVYFQTLLTKFKDPLNSGVLTIASIHGGSATNIIPDEVKLMGTFRSFDNEWREQMHNLINEKSKSLCELYGCECEVNIIKGYPPLVNDIELTNLAKQTANDTFNSDEVLRFVPKMWAEDFAYYSHKIPALFWMLGVNPNPEKIMPPLHNSKLSPDENALLNGTSMLVASAINYLSSK